MIEAFLSRALLVAIRVGGLMTFAPFFSNAALPRPVKGALTLVLTALLMPVYASGAQPVATTAGRWVVMALSEAALGMMAGFTTQFVFDGMELAGQIISFQFGFSLVNVIDPNSQVEVTVLSTFHSFAALLIFMQLGVHRWILRAVAASFQMIPPGSLATVPLPAERLLRMAGGMWLVGAEIAFPVLLATMLVDLTMGFIAKASPQFPAIFLGISTKVLIGLAVLYGAVGMWPGTLERFYFHALMNLESLLTISH